MLIKQYQLNLCSLNNVGVKRPVTIGEKLLNNALTTNYPLMGLYLLTQIIGRL